MQAAGSPRWRGTLDVARRLFTPVALAGLAWAAYHARGEFAALLAQARPWPLVAAVLAWASLNLLVPAISHAWLRGMDASPGYRTLLRIHMTRLPARYLPGGIWHTVSRYVDLHALGTGRDRLAALALLENIAPPAVALMLGGASIAFAGRLSGPAVLLAVSGGAILAIVPFVVIRFWLRSLPSIPAARMLAAFGGLVLFWTTASFAFASYWSAFPANRAAGGLADVVAAYLIGWAAGFAAIFAPQGIGVFEATAAWMLGGTLPFAGLVVLAAGFRAVTLAGDALAYAVGLAWRRAPVASAADEH